MERLSQRLKVQPFVILAVNQQEEVDQVLAFTGQLDPAPTFPILFDRNSMGSHVSGTCWPCLPASSWTMGDHPEIEQTLA